MLESKDLVQESWARVLPVRQRFAELFIARLEELDSQAEQSLRCVEPREHGRRFVDAVTALVRGQDDWRAAASAVEEADAREALVGDALLWALDRVLGGHLTAGARSAWAALLGRHAAELHAAALGEGAFPRAAARRRRRLVQIGS